MRALLCRCLTLIFFVGGQQLFAEHVNIESRGSDYILSVTPGNYSLKESRDEFGTFTEIVTEDGFNIHTGAGNPVLPGKVFTLNGDFSCQVATVEYDTIENVNLRPTRRPLMIGPDYYDTIRTLTYNKIFTEDRYWPENGIIAKSFSMLREVPITTIKLSPFKYNGATKQLIVAKKLVATCKRVGDLGSTRGIKHPLVQNILSDGDGSRVNPSSIEDNGRAGKVVIFTIDSLLPAVEKLARWQKLKGYEVVIASKAGQYAKADVIAKIKSELVDSDAVSKYMMIVGDTKMVEEYEVKWKYFNSIGNMQHVSCSRYGDVDNDGYLPEISRGVVPAKNLEQANIAIDKFIKYETNPVMDESFYGEILGASQEGFVHKSVDKIMDYIDNKGLNTNPRLYLAEDKQRVVDRINEGVIIAAQYDHGYRGGWATPEFTGDQINILENGDKLPYMFSINCLSGTWDYGNGMDKWNPKATYDGYVGLTPRFLFKENGGGIGAFGATNITYTGYNDSLLHDLFKAIWPASESQTPLYRTGDICDYALTKMFNDFGPDVGQYDYTGYHFELYHNMCDPTLQIRTELPTVVTATVDANFKEGDAELKVKAVNLDEATAVIYNEKNGKIIGRAKVSGGSCSIPLNSDNFTNGDTVTLCINGVNCTPFMKTFKSGQGAAVLSQKQGKSSHVAIQANGFSVVNNSQSAMSFSILNMQGQKVFSGKVAKNSAETFTRANLQIAAGSYVVNLLSSEGVKSYKAVFRQ